MFVLCLILSCVVLFMCFSVLLTLQLPRFWGVGAGRWCWSWCFSCVFSVYACLALSFLLVSVKGCGLWLWHSLDFSLTFFLKGFIENFFFINNGVGIVFSCVYISMTSTQLFWPRGYKTEWSMKFSLLINMKMPTMLSMKFSLLINMKMPSIVSIFIFISRENFMLSYIKKQRISNYK